MKGWAARLGLVGLLVVGFAVATAGVHAGAKDGDDEERRVEKRVEVIRLGGGSFLGVRLGEVESGRGAKVESVEPESAAEKAGIQDGDVITGFDGEAVRSARQLARLVRETPAGREVAIEVKRGGATKTLTATLDEGHRFHRELHPGHEDVFIPQIEDLDITIDPPEGLPHAGPHVFRWHGGDHDFTLGWPGRPRLGVQFIEIGEQLAQYFDLDAEEAVLVTGVNEGSPAAEAGIRAGDIVLEFDGESVRDGRDLRGAVRQAKGGQSVVMKVHREGRSVDVQVALPEPEKPKKARRQTGVSL